MSLIFVVCENILFRPSSVVLICAIHDNEESCSFFLVFYTFSKVQNVASLCFILNLKHLVTTYHAV